jgi:alpha-D-xyloside xylohydrolase
VAKNSPRTISNPLYWQRFLYLECPENAAMKKDVLLACFILTTSCFQIASAQPPGKNIVRASDGITIYPDTRFSGNTQAVRLQVVSDKIIRVTASPTRTIPDIKSLTTVYQPVKTNWSAEARGDKISLKTASLTAIINTVSGAVSFTDRNGKPVIAERTFNGRKFSPAVFEGEKSYGMSQVFETTADDAWYGLGQHQDDQFNYRNQQVLLFQNNTEVAVPFLLSSKNYGILWDNYSLTTVGDTRNYLPLSSLKLFSKDGHAGWLTASYSNDRSKPNDIITVKAESEINYPYLGDTRNGLPRAFRPQNGVINWEGSIVSEFSGQHNFRFSYAGYLKVWIDGQLLLDRWRQAWNPGTGIIKPDLIANKKYAVKIQWIPDGGESYLSAKWINPADKADENSYGFSSEAGKQLDYYFISGTNMDEVISGYRTLTGKSTIVPKWAMGFWQSRERYKTQDEIIGAVQEFRKRKIPLDNIVLDWSYWKQNDWGSQEFDNTRFPNPDSMIRAIQKDHKAQFMISVWPKFYEGIPAYKQFDERGWLYKRNVADSQRDWIAQGYVSTFYDVFNKDARKGFWDLLHKKLYTKGIDAWWMDASEPDILSNVNPEKRKAQMTPNAAGLAAEYLNAYPLENARGIYEGQRSVDPDKRVFLLTRSGFAGSQRYGATIWSGDIATRWEDMKAQISAGLNFSMSGLPFWTMDIGGFSVERRYERPKPEDLEEWRELQTRWYQFGAFVPLFRAHGQFPFREIYNIAPETHTAYQSMLYYNKLRYRLMPYLYTLAGMTYHKDYTIMRGLVMDFANDPAVKNIGDQFMLGPSLLINPVYEYRATKHSLYLPGGQGWYNLYTGKYHEGGKRITVEAAYDTIPVFVKEGSILPSGPELQYVAEKPTDTVTLHVYTGKDASFVLYEDESLNYNYEKGRFSNIPVQYNELTRQLTIGERQGSFEGMLQNRVFRIKWISRTRPRPLNFEGSADAVINYLGKATTVSYR